MKKGVLTKLADWDGSTEVWVHEERSADQIGGLGRANDQRSSHGASLVVRGDCARGPDVAEIVFVTHCPVHLTVGVFIAGTICAARLLSPLDLVHALVVDVH